MTDLFLLTRKGSCGIDELNSILVRAVSPIQARAIAAVNSGDEGNYIWLNSKLSKNERIKNEGSVGMVIRDFKAGGW